MKHGKRPTRRQKVLMEAKHLNVENWLVVKNTGVYLEVMHKYSGKTRRVMY